MEPEVPPVGIVAVAALCVWRATHLLVAEDGPWRAIARLRRVAARVLPAGLFACFYCASLWVSVPIAVALAAGWRAQVLLALAASGGAILLERISTRPAVAEVPVPYHEQEVGDAEVLRAEDRVIVE
jgi:hypothetical protein